MDTSNNRLPRLTNTKIFLDSGDPKETAQASQLLKQAGFAGLDGQTTNPSLVAKNPDIVKRSAAGEKLTQAELLAEYKKIIQEIDPHVAGDISIEVYADTFSVAEDMVAQAHEFQSWTDSAVIKLPITTEGLRAAEQLKHEVKLNMTLCFSQQQAGAVYSAARNGDHLVYISPFVGRLDDRGEDGMSLVENILQMYNTYTHGEVEVLVASIRSVDHILESIRLQAPAITINFENAFKPWAEAGFPLPDKSFSYEPAGNETPYEELDLAIPWKEFNLSHELTDTGLARFAADWNNLLK